VEQVWFTAAIWLGLALLATLLAIWFGLSVALTEIVVGTLAQLVIGTWIGPGVLGAREGWVAFLAGLGAIVLTFLAGAELDPDSFRRDWKEATVIGLVGFAAPFLGATWAARAMLGWDLQASLLAGVALSTTSVAVVYAVLLELGLNRTAYGKIVLAACFINDLGTVVALGLIFAPFTMRSLVFVAGLGAVLWVLVRTTGPVFKRYGGRTAELEAKFLLFGLLLLGGLAVWSGSEAVLPAYLVGMVLAGVVGRDHALVRRLRTVTFGLLTPFYFIRAGSFVDIPTVIAGFGVFFVLFAAKAVSKFVGIFPLTRRYGYPHSEGMYTTLLMSTGLTFGTISALYGLSRGIITQMQYSFLVATVIASAVIPTWIANRFFLPLRHLPQEAAEPQPTLATGGD
jgi:glutathione-regulated potassium-efflux system ancillary protein KefC